MGQVANLDHLTVLCLQVVLFPYKNVVFEIDNLHNNTPEEQNKKYMKHRIN